MPSLPNNRYELYAVLRAGGQSMIDAYVGAGYKPDYSAAAKLSRLPQIQARVDELMNEALDRYEVTPDKIIRELALLGFSNPMDLLDANGRVKNVKRMSRDSMAAVKEIETKTVKLADGMVALSTKVKMADKMGPLKTLAQITGLLAQEGPPPQSVVFIVERTGGQQQHRVIEHDE